MFEVIVEGLDPIYQGENEWEAYLAYGTCCGMYKVPSYQSDARTVSLYKNGLCVREMVVPDPGYNLPHTD